MFFLYCLAGLVGGVLGGMGMGGGTVLIPLLSIFFNVEQQVAQAINLISFIPMAIIALIIHTKNKLVDYKGVWLIILPGVAFGVGGALLAKCISGEALKKIFGVFLILLSGFQIFTAFKQKNKT